MAYWSSEQAKEVASSSPYRAGPQREFKARAAQDLEV